LVHEDYLRPCEQQDPEWQGRAHFFAVTAKMIRRIPVDHARPKSAAKLGGRRVSTFTCTGMVRASSRLASGILLDQSLHEPAAFHPRKSQIVEMRFFGGLSANDIAAGRNTTEASVRRDWNIARAWLYRCTQGESTP
jgi:RNA polymerase sigma factor (TIGR02999 family)